MKIVQQYEAFTVDNVDQLTDTVSQFLRYSGVEDTDTDLKIVIMKQGEVCGILKYFAYINSVGEVVDD